MAYVWFSPLGEKKYAKSEATMIKTRPMIMLALLERFMLASSFVGIGAC